jgi:hypothetical protein
MVSVRCKCCDYGLKMIGFFHGKDEAKKVVDRIARRIGLTAPIKQIKPNLTRVK